MRKLFSRRLRYFIVAIMQLHIISAICSKLMRFFPALILLMLLWSTPSQAEWQKVTSTDSGIIYIDDASMKKQGSVRSFWSVFDYKAPQKAQRGAFYVSTRTHMEMDCRKEIVHILQFSMHSGPMLTGEIIDSQGVMREWQTIPPDTPLVNIFKFVCQR
jgi:hypothetical protein